MSDDLGACVVAIHRGGETPGDIVGTGILLSSRYVLTCAHVVAEALGDLCFEPDKASADQLIPVVVGGMSPPRQQRYVTIVRAAWRADKNHQEPESDIALLKLTEPVNFSEHWFRVGVPQRGEEVDICGFPCEEGLWSTANFAGVAGYWGQLNFNKNTIEGGCSGGPVMDVGRRTLYGMVVARQNQIDVAYMIPVSELKKVSDVLNLLDESSSVPFISVLAKNLNRTKQLQNIKDTTEKQKFHCFVVECIAEDMPQCFVSKLKIRSYLERQGLLNLSESDVNAIEIRNEGFTKTSFREALNSKVPGGLENWIRATRGEKVVYVLSENRDYISQLEALAEVLAELSVTFSNQPNISPLVVVAPFFSSQFGMIQRHNVRRGLKKLIRQNPSRVTLLPPLTELKDKDLREFVPSLPPKAQQDFKAHFHHEHIDAHFMKRFKAASSHRYEDLIVDFEEVLKEKLKKTR